MDLLQTLKVNPLLRPRHYQYYFDVPQRTASRFFGLDRSAIGDRFLTFLDFFKRYGAFPDPKFKPAWVDIPAPRYRLK